MFRRCVWGDSAFTYNNVVVSFPNFASKHKNNKEQNNYLFEFEKNNNNK